MKECHSDLLADPGGTEDICSDQLRLFEFDGINGVLLLALFTAALKIVSQLCGGHPPNHE